MPLVSWEDLSALGFDSGKSYHHLVSEIFTLSPNRQKGQLLSEEVLTRFLTNWPIFYLIDTEPVPCSPHYVRHRHCEPQSRYQGWVVSSLNFAWQKLDPTTIGPGQKLHVPSRRDCLDT